MPFPTVTHRTVVSIEMDFTSTSVSRVKVTDGLSKCVMARSRSGDEGSFDVTVEPVSIVASLASWILVSTSILPLSQTLVQCFFFRCSFLIPLGERFRRRYV